MQELYDKLKKYSLEDAIKLEHLDRQFIALKKLSENMKDKKNYLSLVIANSVICYQLSWKWEDYWEEFSDYFSDTFQSNPIFQGEEILNLLWRFIKQSKNNKRFVETKIKRLEKLRLFLEEFNIKTEYFYRNMLELRDILAKTMKQKTDAKTIVFAVKMFWYAARNVYSFESYPDEITIPVDSRLMMLFEKYKWDYTDINKFYSDLSEKLKIAELHLDVLVWLNYDELIK